MEAPRIIRYKTISQYHQDRNLPKPEHPLISILDAKDLPRYAEPISMIADYYMISLKRNFTGKFKYGQNDYDFDEGVMVFLAPNQVFRIEHSKDQVMEQTGWLLLIHPDFLWNSPLAKTIRQFGYFDYAVNEALFLSDKEESVMNNIISNIRQEYHSNIDKFSQSIIISQLETLLNYAERFYHRQFITRRIVNNSILEKMEALLDQYFGNDELVRSGLPTVKYIADSLLVSPNYLGNMLRVLTGQSTQQHIHARVIEEAKARLSATSLSVSEVAYAVGFEHSQSFSKFFKLKTKQSPLEFRKSFN